MGMTQTVTAKIEFPFTDDDIDLHIFGSGFEYYGWWWQFKTVDNGYVVTAEDPNYPDDGVKTISKTVSNDDIRRVMGEILERKHQYTGNARWQIQNGIGAGDFEIDADGADLIMQVAMYGKVVFG
jgi:hypothetical protein